MDEKPMYSSVAIIQRMDKDEGERDDTCENQWRYMRRRKSTRSRNSQSLQQ
jgi:hypothetical protein